VGRAGEIAGRRPEWTRDPALADSLERSRRGAEINRHIRAWAITRKVDDIVREGQALSVPLARYYTPAEVLRDPHEAHRGLFSSVNLAVEGGLPMLVSPPSTSMASRCRFARRAARMKPLNGIRIADFTVHNAGPFATHLLSQLGADVIKIESAMRPDAFRKPHPVYGRMGPATFDQVASTKRSVRINLKKPEGVALAKRIVGVSDVAAESFRAGVLARLGLGFDA
jgi:crotonobetainyl-CoA:carnitine CoA-transferase CaiB-like acyl-CoA transferase